MKFLLASFVATLASLAAASPIDAIAMDSYAPPITEPTETTVWPIGSTQVVTWDTSDAPPHITNPNGYIYLRRDGLTNYAQPLAGPFDILAGSQSVVVPQVEPGVDWILVLQGNSGNWSPEFTITEA